MDLMPAHMAQSPEIIASVQEANARIIAAHQQAAGARAPPPDLLQTDNPEVLRQYLTACGQGAGTHYPSATTSLRSFS